jgi:hypothetical protein
LYERKEQIHLDWRGLLSSFLIRGKNKNGSLLRSQQSNVADYLRRKTVYQDFPSIINNKERFLLQKVKKIMDYS